MKLWTRRRASGMGRSAIVARAERTAGSDRSDGEKGRTSGVTGQSAADKASQHPPAVDFGGE